MDGDQFHLSNCKGPPLREALALRSSDSHVSSSTVVYNRQ